MFKIKNGDLCTIICPNTLKNQKCLILNCLFDHNDYNHLHEEPSKHELESKRKSESENMNDDSRKSIKITENSTPASFGVNSSLNFEDNKFVLPKGINHLYIDRKLRTVQTHKLVKYFKDRSNNIPIKSAINKEYEIATRSKSVEEYEKGIVEFLNPKHACEEDPKFILPREVVPNSPAPLQVRKKFIQTFVDSIKKVQPSLKTPVLNAIDEEYKVAVAATSNTYNTLIKKRIYQILNPEKIKKEDNTINEKEYLKKLEELVIPVTKLSRYGYIMEKPIPEEPETIKTCKRCNNEFRLDEQLLPTKCYYHSGKALKRDDNSRVYECCGGVVGGETDTCAFSEHHVFYPKNPEEMEWFSPFQYTEEIFGPKKNSFKAVGIDCEMGYTTKGFELLRITAVDFFSGEDVIDIVVKPKGEVIDLNTKWSGISEIKDEALTFEELISLLGEVIDYNTILIGHGLENDMNTMRLIHKRIIDTAILYPKHQTSPTFRYPLKYLTFRYLGRTIQTGEHDSSEDSLAAIDIVKYFIKLNK